MQTDKLRSLCFKIGSGATPRGGSAIYISQGVSLIRSQNIYNDGFKYDGLAYIDKNAADSLMNVEVKENDNLLNITGDSVARSCIVPNNILPARVNQHVAIIRPDPSKLDFRFLHYLLISETMQDRLLSLAGGGATRKALTKAMIEDLDIPQLPISDQRFISHYLGSLDDKIELNRRMNETLEAIARAIFKSWFIDFDPVRAKAEGKQPFGMDEETAALFPSEFEDSELGEIPKGWQVKPLDNIASFLNGLALQKYPAEADEYLPVIKIAELRNGITASSGKASLDVPPDYIINDGDVIFSWSGSLECVIWCGGRGALNQHLFKVTSRDHPKWFYYHWVHHHLPEFRAIAAGKATTMGHIQRGHLHDALVVVPPSHLMEHAEGVFTPLIEKFILNRLESHNLASIRDMLLPKLLSGEIRVPMEAD